MNNYSSSTLICLIKSVFIFITISFSSSAIAKEWYPLQIEVWDPPFNKERQRILKEYTPLQKSEKRWDICVSIPHLKDAYWLAVNFGLVDEAKRLGVNLSIYEAGGYDRLEVQQKQIAECIDKNVDGLIISAIAADGLNELVKDASDRKIPVLDLINGINSPHLSARIAVDFFDTGFQAGEYLKQLVEKNSTKTHVAWFPGPEGAGWVAAGDKGFRTALKNTHIEIIASLKGDTGIKAQSNLIESVLDDLGDNVSDKLDYIVGTTVSAEAAVSILRKRGLSKQIKVLSYYYGPGVHKGVKRGNILAAPTDSQAIQARIAVDTMVRILDGQPFFKHAAPIVKVIDRINQRTWDSTTTLAPRGFRPIFTVTK
jgi:protein TorT